MTFEDWRTLVRLAYQGGEPTQAALLRGLVDGARAIMVRDIESDLALAKSYSNSFREGKVKMAGGRFTTNLTATTALAKTIMPIDDDTAAATAMMDNAIASAYDDVSAMADKWDAYLLECAIDLQRHVPFYQARQITSFLYDTAGVETVGFVSKVALPEYARIQQLAYGHYYAPLEYDVVYAAEDRVISNGRVYEVVVGGTLTVYELADGLTSTDFEDEALGSLTFKLYAPERDWPVRQMEWSARNRLAAGDFSGGPAYCFPPQGDQIWLFPALDDTHRFDLEWVGVAEEFADDDEVTFDRTAAEAAAHYIRQMLYLTEMDDAKQAAASLAFYQKALRKAVIDCSDRDTGTPTQVQPYDYRRRCWFWGSCCPPIVVNPGSGGMENIDEISLSSSSGNRNITATARIFTVALSVTGAAGERIFTLIRTGHQRGDRLTIVCTLAEVEGILLEFLSGPGGASLLPEQRFPDNQFYTDGIGTSATFEFYYNGSHWVYEGATIPA